MVDLIQDKLFALSIEEKRIFLPSFFKTGKGEYGEGDKFIGVIVPDIRKVAKLHKDISFEELTDLLRNDYHECRLCALFILIDKFKKSDEKGRSYIFDLYLSHTKFINNWDLVDSSSTAIVGEYLFDKNREILYQLADSPLLWDQRIAVIATLYFIRKNDFTDILALSEILLFHKHDLMHKAVGWMLREVGNRNKTALTNFLDKHHQVMPRTMLRYSIEKFSSEERAHYMKKRI